MTDDKKKKLPSCVDFGLRYWERLQSKFDKMGENWMDWMTSKVQKKWFLACYARELLEGLIDGDDVYDYKLFFALGYKLIDLVSSVNFELIKYNNDKKEN
jgi:hypothetical protein